MLRFRNWPARRIIAVWLIWGAALAVLTVAVRDPRFRGAILWALSSEDVQVTGIHMSASPFALMLGIVGPPLLLTLLWVWLRRKPPRARLTSA